MQEIDIKLLKGISFSKANTSKIDIKKQPPASQK